MTRRKAQNSLFVYMNNRQVGSLRYLAGGRLAFEYTDAWLEWEGVRPISLSLPLKKGVYQGEEVWRYFDNLLPDNQQIRERIQRRFHSETNHSFDLLSYIGKDCIGALQLLTQPLEVKEENIIAGDKLSDKEISSLLKNYQYSPLGMNESLKDFRISLAGAQEKTALLWHDNSWKVPKETTPTSHIIKLPIGQIEHAGIDLRESVENEWLCLKILSEYGLPTAEANIHKFLDLTTLVVKRFDRRWSQDNKILYRLPQEDCCQALGISSGLKYESDGGPGIVDVMKLLERSENFTHNRYMFMKTVFLFWVLGAIDGHGKNFSIFLHAQGRFELTPIYDVISAYPLVKKGQLQWQKLKMAMSVKGKNTHYFWHNIQLRHWLNTASLCKFPEKDMLNIIEEVFDRLDSVTDTINNTLPKTFPQNISEGILEGVKNFKKNLS